MRVLKGKTTHGTHTKSTCTQNHGNDIGLIKLHMEANRSRKAHEYCERNARIVCEKHFRRYFATSCDGGKNAFAMHHSFQMNGALQEHFSISLRFPNLCSQISRPLAYGVYIFSKAHATAVNNKSWSLTIRTNEMPPSTIFNLKEPTEKGTYI